MLKPCISLGIDVISSPSPIPIRNSSNVKPIVAPDTNGSALRYPLLTPIESVIMFTGPGEIDIASENAAIANKVDMLDPMFEMNLIYPANASSNRLYNSDSLLLKIAQ